jgi:hypothetical protein
MTLPGGAKQEVWAAQEGLGTIRILKRGDAVTIDLGGMDKTGGHDDTQLTGNVSDFKRFTRFEMDLYKGSNTIMSVTNFKVGNLGIRDSTRSGSGVTPRRRSFKAAANPFAP